MACLILIRHGESEWNRDNRFTGWADVGLTEPGRQNMVDAGRALRRQGFGVDLAFSSVLSRCVLSHWALLEGWGQVWTPSILDWRLNERHYGALTGLSKSQAMVTYGAAAVQRWRRSYAVAPPMEPNRRDGAVLIDARYAQLDPAQIPQGESLAQVVERVRPAWEDAIKPALRSGQRVVVTAHGNSLRALLKIIQGITDEDIVNVEVPNALPMVLRLDEQLDVMEQTVVGHAATPPSEIL